MLPMPSHSSNVSPLSPSYCRRSLSYTIHFVIFMDSSSSLRFNPYLTTEFLSSLSRLWVTSFLHHWWLLATPLSPLQVSFVVSRSSWNVVHHIFLDSVCRRPTPSSWQCLLVDVVYDQWISVFWYSPCLTSASALTFLHLHHWLRGHAKKFNNFVNYDYYCLV